MSHISNDYPTVEGSVYDLLAYRNLRAVASSHKISYNANWNANIRHYCEAKATYKKLSSTILVCHPGYFCTVGTLCIVFLSLSFGMDSEHSIITHCVDLVLR